MKGLWNLPILFSIILTTSCMKEELRGGETAADTSDINGHSDPARYLSRTQIMEQYSNVSCESLRHLIDYLDQIGSTDYFRGLSGEIYYQPQTCREGSGVWKHLDKFYTEEESVKIDAKLYLSKLDVPTRKFTLGFPKLDGSKIQNTEGEDLLEYFSIDFRSDLKLSDLEEEGEYEFALLSDDGVEMTVDGEVIARSPGVHQTKMVCATEVVDLKMNELKPIRIRYFQGPRHHIALTLLWRKAGQGEEPLCGVSGNSAFFDYNQDPSLPKENYHSLIQRGWNVVPAHVFRIPRDEYMNPCESDYVREVIGESKPDETCTATSCAELGL